MGRRSEQGKRAWEARRAQFGPDLRNQIVAEAHRREERWQACGRVPWLVRAKAQLRRWILGSRAAGFVE